MTGSAEGHTSGGVFFNVAIQGRSITLTLPDRPDLTRAGIPRESANFAGRRTELEQVLAALAPTAQDKTAGTVVVSGLAGTGKTELVLQAARQALREGSWFPGGALFVDLHGYGTEAKVSPKQALGTLLRALGIPRNIFLPGSRNGHSSTGPRSVHLRLPGDGSWLSWTTYQRPARSATSCRAPGAPQRSCPLGTRSRNWTPWR